MACIEFNAQNPPRSMTVTTGSGAQVTLHSGRSYDLDDATVRRLLRDFPSWFETPDDAPTEKIVHPETKPGFLDRMIHPGDDTLKKKNSSSKRKGRDGR